MPKILFLLLAVAFRSSADTKPAEVRDVRHHHQVVGKQGAIVYDVTMISRFSEESSENYVLVRDPDHGEFVIRRVWTFKNQGLTYRMSDVKDRTFVQATATAPFASKTRQETLEESRMNPTLSMLPAMIRLETNGGTWDSVETDWEDTDAMRKFRHQLRRSIDFFLLEALERMRGTPLAGSTVDTFFPLIGQLFVYEPASDDVIESSKMNEAAPDCGFDEHFGFPCSSKQLERVRKAAKDGKSLSHY